MAKKKRKTRTSKKTQEQPIVSKMVYLIVTLVFFIVANMYCTDLLLDEMDLGLTVSNPVFALRYVQNTGAAFSLLEEYPYAVTILSVFALLLVLSPSIWSING